jgi:hypothetical protein
MYRSFLRSAPTCAPKATTSPTDERDETGDDPGQWLQRSGAQLGAGVRR